MTYHKLYKESNAKAKEITKEEARQTLDGYWDKDCLVRIFKEEIGFQLNTPFALVWTKDDKGRVPMAGFIGTLE